MLQIRVPVDSFRDFSKEQVTTVATKQSPGLVTAHGSFEAFCPSRSVSRDHASRDCHRGGSVVLQRGVSNGGGKVIFGNLL